MHAAGVGERLAREGMRHNGIYLAFDGARHQIDMARLTGRAITIYGQNEVVHDLIEARLATGRPLVFEAQDVQRRRPGVHGAPHSLPDRRRGARADVRLHRRLRRLSRRLPAVDSGRGAARLRARLPVRVARHPGRGPAVVRRTRLQPSRARLRAVQHALAADHQALPAVRDPTKISRRGPTTGSGPSSMRASSTSDGWRPNQGPILQKSVTGMRSFVAEPMRFGRLFLAGDAAHIVPPTGAKGLEPRDGGRLPIIDGVRAVLSRATRHAVDCLLGPGAAPHLARAAVLVVDDVDAAHRLRPTTPSTTAGSSPNWSILSAPTRR